MEFKPAAICSRKLREQFLDGIQHSIYVIMADIVGGLKVVLLDRLIKEADWRTMYCSLIDSIIMEFNTLFYNVSVYGLDD